MCLLCRVVQLIASRPEISERFLITYCYSAHYVLTLLVDGYKFDPDTWQNIAFEKEVGNAQNMTSPSEKNTSEEGRNNG